jgi:septum formation protein
MDSAGLILASASPRRAALLTQLGVSFTPEPADIDESQYPQESPRQYVQRIAASKAQAVATRFPAPDYAVLSADTTVVIDGSVLGKPQDEAQAMATLSCLSGRWHSVMTAICLSTEQGLHCEVVVTEVEFVALSEAVCRAYLAAGESWDKAGAYGIQGLGGALVRSIRGSYTNVVGLPLSQTWQLLAAHNIATRLTPSAGSSTGCSTGSSRGSSRGSAIVQPTLD